jgi:hypothetical protein
MRVVKKDRRHRPGLDIHVGTKNQRSLTLSVISNLPNNHAGHERLMDYCEESVLLVVKDFVMFGLEVTSSVYMLKDEDLKEGEKKRNVASVDIKAMSTIGKFKEILAEIKKRSEKSGRGPVRVYKVFGEKKKVRIKKKKLVAVSAPKDETVVNKTNTTS